MKKSTKFSIPDGIESTALVGGAVGAPTPREYKSQISQLSQTARQKMFKGVDLYMGNQSPELSYEERYECTPNCNPDNGGPPIFTVAVLIAVITFYFIYNGTSVAESALAFKYDEIYMNHQVWRYLSYALLHASATHLMTNCIMFGFVCAMLELSQDSFRPALIFLFGIMFGSLLSGLVMQESTLVGMSGGCYAL